MIVARRIRIVVALLGIALSGVKARAAGEEDEKDRRIRALERRVDDLTRQVETMNGRRRLTARPGTGA